MHGTRISRLADARDVAAHYGHVGHDKEGQERDKAASHALMLAGLLQSDEPSPDRMLRICGLGHR